jgi:hypothetical protein
MANLDDDDYGPNLARVVYGADHFDCEHKKF